MGFSVNLKKYLFYIFIIFGSFFIISCGGSEPDEDEEVEETDDNEGEEEVEEEETTDTLEIASPEKDKEIADLKSKIELLEKDLDNCNQALSMLKNEYSKKTEVVEKDYKTGLYYRIQLGARYISQGGFNFYETSRIMGNDIVQEDNFDKIRIGYYNTYNEAKIVEFVIRKSGNRNTWIVPILDSRRIPIRQAIQIEKDYNRGTKNNL